MSTEAKPAVTINFFVLIPIDVEVLYKTALEVSKEFKGVLLGVHPFNFANPNRDVQYISLTVDLELMGKLREKIKSNLNLKEENLLYSVIPSMLPKEKPAPVDMAT